jgi:hypothetical protein
VTGCTTTPLVRSGEASEAHYIGSMSQAAVKYRRHLTFVAIYGLPAGSQESGREDVDYVTNHGSAFGQD